MAGIENPAYLGLECGEIRRIVSDHHDSINQIPFIESVLEGFQRHNDNVVNSVSHLNLIVLIGDTDNAICDSVHKDFPPHRIGYSREKFVGDFLADNRNLAHEPFVCVVDEAAGFYRRRHHIRKPRAHTPYLSRIGVTPVAETYIGRR